jgi:hypothetical protein
MTNKLKAFNLTGEHFERARADIAHRRKEMNAKLDLELEGLAAFETTAADFAERYPEDAAPPAPAPSRHRKSHRSNAGRPYKPKENAQILAASRGRLRELAADLGRPYEGVQKQHEVLLKKQIYEDARRQQREPEKAPPTRDEAAPEAPLGDDPALEMAKYSHRLEVQRALEVEKGEEPINWGEAYPQPAPETPGSEKPEIVEPTKPEMTDGERRVPRTPSPKRGLDVTGRIVDNGPLDQRIYDPGFALPRPGG